MSSICTFVIAYHGPKLPMYPNTEKTRMDTVVMAKQYHRCYYQRRNIFRLCVKHMRHIGRVILSVCALLSCLHGKNCNAVCSVQSNTTASLSW